MTATDKVAHELGAELQRWFATSVIPVDGIDFDDVAAFVEALVPFRQDYRRYFTKDADVDITKFAYWPNLQAVLLYRIAHVYYLAKREDVALKYSALGRWLCGCELFHSAEIGPGFQLHHGMGTVIGARCKIGKNVTVFHRVNIGDRWGGRPVIGDYAVIYSGAHVLGAITVGKKAMVGANAVCLADVPPNTVVAGIPARIISKVDDRPEALYNIWNASED